MRRNAVRRKGLDEGHAKEAMKILERYVRKKYRNSTLFPDSDSQCPTGSEFSPNAPPFLRQATCDRLSTTAQSTNYLDFRPPLSPTYTFDFSEHSLREDIKFDKTKETWSEYLVRITKYSYENLGLKHLILILVLLIYAFAGGFMFNHLEAPAELLRLEELQRESYIRIHSISQNIVESVVQNKCSPELVSPKEYNKEHDLLNHTYTECQFRIRKLLLELENDLKILYDIGDEWHWDFWNAVFYAGTIFTTIGYGTISCKTKIGRLATILYAVFGVPLMLVVLNSMGTGLFTTLENLWERFRRRMKRKVRTLHKTYLKRSSTIESVHSDEVLDLQDQSVSDESSELFETFPLYLALLIVFIYILVVAIVFCYWEDWDYFTSFYFFFISLSTVGFGDVMPRHPKYACSFFLVFIVGLSLVSMCISILQMKVEHKYMAALQLIDEEHRERLESSEEPEIVELKTPNSLHVGKAIGATTPGSIRWRSRENSGTERIESQYLGTPLDGFPPPVLGVFMARQLSTRQSSRRPMARSESINYLHKQSPMSYSSEHDVSNISPQIRSQTTNLSDVQSPTLPTSPMSCSSRNVSGSMQNLSASRQVIGALSVITEGDEESAQSRQNSKRKPNAQVPDAQWESPRIEGDIDLPEATPEAPYPIESLTVEENRLAASVRPVERRRNLEPPSTLNLSSVLSREVTPLPTKDVPERPASKK